MIGLQPLIAVAAVALVAGIASGLGVRAAAPFVERGSSARWAAAALVPCLVAASMLVALLTPNPLSGGCHCALHADHHPHLCWTHPAQAGPLVVPALVVLGVWLLVCGPALGRVALAIVRSSLLAHRVRGVSPTVIDGVPVHVVDCGEPVAFTAGLVWPRVIVDRALACCLDAPSLRAVVHHEHAHASRRDGLTLAILRVVAAGFPAGSLGTVVARWIAASEAECDRHAACRVGSPADVASALVAVERLRAHSAAPRSEVVPAISSADLVRRVSQLLGDQPRRPRLASDALFVGAVLVACSALVALWPGDAAHHVTETLLGAAVHH